MSKSRVTYAETRPFIDVEQVIRHLELLHGPRAHGWMCVAYVDAAVPRSHWDHHWADDHATGLQDIREQPDVWRRMLVARDDKLQVYVSLCTFKKTGAKPQRQKKFAREIPGVWADIDVKPGLENHFQSRAQVDAFLDKLPMPTLLVNSGSGGCHAYWLFDRRAQVNQRTIDLLEGWHEYLQETARPVLIDNVQETARVLRLAGTVRWSKPAEVRAGAAPFTRVMIERETDRRFALADLEALALPALARRDERRAAERQRFKDSRDSAIANLERRGLSAASQVYLETKFNELQDWGELLTRAGWSLSEDNRGTGGSSDCRYWIRPGADPTAHAGASTDYRESTIITFFSSEVDNLAELIHPGIPQAIHGCTTKYRFALIALYDGNEGRLIKDIAKGKGRLP